MFRYEVMNLVSLISAPGEQMGARRTEEEEEDDEEANDL